MMTSQQNEAVCLLEKGALYTRREGFQREGRDLVFAGFKQGAFSLYFGDSPIYHFDLEGRWQRAYIRDRHYLRRLDGLIHEVDRVREGGSLVMKRRTLGPAEVVKLDEEVRGVAESLLADLDGELGSRIAPPNDRAEPIGESELREFLTRIAGWDASAWNASRLAYETAYGPLPMLPPDVPNAIILQATLGDRDGRSFAAAPVRDHLVRTPEQFEKHTRDVARLLGRRQEQSRSVFLAGADVLRLPAADVLAYLDVIARDLKGDEAEGRAIENVHAFLDDFQPPVAVASTLRAARQRRLTRIALGVESGAPELRRLYGKDWCDADLQAFAAEAKAAGIELSVLTLVGAGGGRRRSEHVERTVHLIESLLLTAGDLVFLLDEREIADPSVPLHEGDRLDDATWNAQLGAMREGLAGLRDRGVKVVPYSLAKQTG